MTTYIKISTLEYPRHIGDIEADSTGASDYAIVEWVDLPAYNRETQRCEQNPPVLIDGTWRMVWEVRAATAKEIEYARIRSTRKEGI